MTPAETAAWDAEIDRGRRDLANAIELSVWPNWVAMNSVRRMLGVPIKHARPYSRLRERDIFDEAHTPRHAKRSHRAEVAA